MSVFLYAVTHTGIIFFMFIFLKDQKNLLKIKNQIRKSTIVKEKKRGGGVQEQQLGKK